MRNKKNTAIYLLIVLSFTLLASCATSTWNISDKKPKNMSGQTAQNGSNAGSEGKSEENVVLTYWAPLESWALPAIKTYDDNEAINKAKEITGISIKWIHPPIAQETEMFNLMIASDELPDIVQQAARYRGGLSKGVKDGVYLRLNELIDKYAPSYKWLRGMDPEIAKLTIDDSGTICAFFGISPYVEWEWWGPLLRKDWMDELGLDTPETIEDWYQLLTLFKEKKGAEAPLLFPPTGADWRSVFMSAYDAYNWMFYKDGKVQFGPIQPGMKDYLIEMRKWYAEGLIDRFFTGRDWNQWVQMTISGKSGAFLQSPETMSGIYVRYGLDIEAAPYPVLRKGDKIHMRGNYTKNLGYEAAITTSCKHPELAAKWLDFGYSQKGWELYNYGKEGRTHIKNSEGKPVIWDESIIYNDPEGIPAINALWKYKLHFGPFLRDEHSANPILIKNKKAQEIRKLWTETNDAAYCMPPAALLPEEGGKDAAIATQLSTYINEMIVKFIMGVEPIEKFDNYVEQINKMGLDEMLRMWQNAVDRYHKRQG